MTIETYLGLVVGLCPADQDPYTENPADQEFVRPANVEFLIPIVFMEVDDFVHKIAPS